MKAVKARIFFSGGIYVYSCDLGAARFEIAEVSKKRNSGVQPRASSATDVKYVAVRAEQAVDL